LTGNILAYLGDSSQWRKVVVRPLPGVQAAKPGVPEKQWKSLELAIADLMETFGDRYPKGREYLRRLESLRKPHDKITAAAPGKQERLAKITEEFGKLIREPDVDNYDACYLPDGPDPLHLHGPLHSRRLFHMNPDGTAQMEYISSNSYFPNPRSGYTAMPGETVSCVGCHEQQNSGPPNRQTVASQRPPSEIEPWYGPVRGFAFHREVQPVLDRYCVGCPKQPAVRLSWNHAVEFCRWLSRETGKKFNLPTEAPWEYACRAGTSTPFSYGDLDADFSKFANLGDAKLRELAIDTYIHVHTSRCSTSASE
jgi:hypothetical protein